MTGNTRAYDQLKRFISTDMRMSHIYQPVMLIELLKHDGHSTTQEIAQAILNRDPSQLEYYSEIVKKMVGQVLTKKHGIAVKDGDVYFLRVSKELTESERNELIALCETSIRDYEEKRAGAHWDHRRRGRRPVSGSIRYEVLKRASFRCELCGISADDKNLEVDHIDPRSLGGKNDLSNYQALCYTCNSQKNNKDNADFRGLKVMYAHRVESCLFCEVQAGTRDRIIEENALAYAVRDGYPVTPHHTLLIPKRHVENYFSLTQPEVNAIHALMLSQKTVLTKLDTLIDGFNIGMNCGEVAGQSVWHCHVHLIPRRAGDVESPKGGVRHVIPHKGHYEAGH